MVCSRPGRASARKLSAIDVGHGRAAPRRPAPCRCRPRCVPAGRDPVERVEGLHGQASWRGWRHPGRLVGHFGVLRRPRCIVQPRRPVTRGQLQERLQRLGGGGHVGPRVAPARHAARARCGWSARRDPGRPPRPSRRGSRPGRRPGPGEPGAEDRLVRGVLVEVDEDPLSALLLPPSGGDQVGVPPLQLPGQGHRGRRGLRWRPSGAGGGGRRACPGCPWSSGSPVMPSSSSSVAAEAAPPRAPRRTRCRAGGRDRCAARRRAPGRRPGRARGAARDNRG